MWRLQSNISQSERVTRFIVGVLLLASLLGHFVKSMALCLGVICFVEGMIGWCGIPILLKRFKSERSCHAIKTPQEKLTKVQANKADISDEGHQ